MNGTYHNHTTWSDGDYTPEQLVERAIQLRFEEVAITDHYFTRKGFINCVSNEQLDDYLSMIEDLRKKYPGIKIFAGLEIDVSMFNTQINNLPFDKLNKLDYVLFEYVDEQDKGLWAKTDMRRAKITEFILDARKKIERIQETEGLEAAVLRYTRIREEVQQAFKEFEEEKGVLSLEDVFAIRKNLTCKVGLAHPNMQNLICIYGAENLAKLLAENNIFVDVCGSERNSRRGDNQRGFVLNAENLGEEFEEAARKYKVKFISSSDTHRDNSRDSMQDTLNAIQLIQINDWQFQEF